MQGKAKIVTKNKDIALYNFYAIGNYNPGGTFDGSEWQFLMMVPTGELSFLSNSVAIYKNQVDKNGNGTFLLWHWR